MANLIINREGSTPFVSFKEDGNLFIEGRSLVEDPKKIYSRLFEWVRNLIVNKVDFIVKIEYMNTASTKMLIKLFNEIENNKSIESINVEWHYELDDPDMMELGEMIEEELERTTFNYFECVDLEYA